VQQANTSLQPINPERGKFADLEAWSSLKASDNKFLQHLSNAGGYFLANPKGAVSQISGEE
jgi:hypothetical protein